MEKIEKQIKIKNESSLNLELLLNFGFIIIGISFFTFYFLFREENSCRLLINVSFFKVGIEIISYFFYLFFTIMASLYLLLEKYQESKLNFFISVNKNDFIFIIILDKLLQKLEDFCVMSIYFALQLCLSITTFLLSCSRKLIQICEIIIYRNFNDPLKIKTIEDIIINPMYLVGLLCAAIFNEFLIFYIYCLQTPLSLAVF